MAKMCGCGKPRACSCGQSQESLTDQLRALYAIANQYGYYDAADFIDRAVNRGQR